MSDWLQSLGKIVSNVANADLVGGSIPRVESKLTADDEQHRKFKTTAEKHEDKQDRLREELREARRRAEEERRRRERNQ
ncbi:hypothetical protein L596_012067 [Steinernema carpocapsae]|uniref:Uncharacterized protein n=1 Tax=Steinernema carpocapsae TaxID=34508 RepID=A0A4U5NWL0_STECR|nr:hypothetical protein L596_012067 [Steinernema carpocapsae]